MRCTMINTIIQVLPTDDYKVYLYFAHGEIKLYDATEILDHGIFRVLKDKKIFAETCTVLNNTLAWDLKGNFDPYECLDLDPEVLYEKSITVEDPLHQMNTGA